MVRRVLSLKCDNYLCHGLYYFYYFVRLAEISQCIMICLLFSTLYMSGMAIDWFK